MIRRRLLGIGLAVSMAFAGLSVAPSFAGDVRPPQLIRVPGGAPSLTFVGSRPSQLPFTEPWRITSPPNPQQRMIANSAFVIGDSLTYDTWFDGQIRARGNRQGLHGIGIEAQGGITTGQMLTRIRAVPWRTNMPSRVLIGLGTNDAFHQTPPATFRSQLVALINQVRTGVQPRSIVLVNISATGNADVDAWAQKLNRIINSFANGRAIQLLNWSQILPRHPGWLLPNDPYKVHLTPGGRSQRAGLYLAALRKLR